MPICHVEDPPQTAHGRKFKTDAFLREGLADLRYYNRKETCDGKVS